MAKFAQMIGDRILGNCNAARRGVDIIEIIYTHKEVFVNRSLRSRDRATNLFRPKKGFQGKFGLTIN
eukprot:13562696-Heterocapsa_arctica.AAC.1